LTEPEILGKELSVQLEPGRAAAKKKRRILENEIMLLWEVMGDRNSSAL